VRIRDVSIVSYNRGGCLTLQTFVFLGNVSAPSISLYRTLITAKSHYWLDGDGVKSIGNRARAWADKFLLRDESYSNDPASF
jgi:hypothetical protein